MDNKLAIDGRLVTFDLNGPDLSIAQSDRYAFAINQAALLCPECAAHADRPTYCARHLQPALARARCTRALIQHVVTTATENKMDVKDGAIWAEWHKSLEAIDDEVDGINPHTVTAVQVTVGQLRWLKRFLDREDVRVRVGMAQWRAAVSDYVSRVLTEALEPRKKLSTEE